MKKLFKNRIYLIIAVVGALMTSCVTPNTEELFPPDAAASCIDGILNQGEYDIDCGGPCAPCATQEPEIIAIIDSTWFIDSLKTGNNRFVTKNLTYNYTKDTGYVWITAVSNYAPPDEAKGQTISFRIPINVNRGIHEIIEPDDGEYLLTDPVGGNYPGERVGFDNGVITITNKDDVNGVIRGNFEFVCQPSQNDYRTIIRSGEFIDIPTR